MGGGVAQLVEGELENCSAFFEVRLSKGKNVLTVHILTNGNMNLAYFDFQPVHK